MTSVSVEEIAMVPLSPMEEIELLVHKLPLELWGETASYAALSGFIRSCTGTCIDRVAVGAIAHLEQRQEVVQYLVNTGKLLQSTLVLLKRERERGENKKSNTKQTEYEMKNHAILFQAYSLSLKKHTHTVFKTQHPEWFRFPTLDSKELVKKNDIVAEATQQMRRKDEYWVRVFIAQQCNCRTTKARGLSAQLFKTFPFANCYSDKSCRIVGKAQIRQSYEFTQQPCIVNLFGQDEPGKVAGKKETLEQRLLWFNQSLDDMEKELEAYGYATPFSLILFPKYIGCGLAGGQWSSYLAALNALNQRCPCVIRLVER